MIFLGSRSLCYAASPDGKVNAWAPWETWLLSCWSSQLAMGLVWFFFPFWGKAPG